MKGKYPLLIVIPSSISSIYLSLSIYRYKLTFVWVYLSFSIDQDTIPTLTPHPKYQKNQSYRTRTAELERICQLTRPQHHRMFPDKGYRSVETEWLWPNQTNQ